MSDAPRFQVVGLIAKPDADRVVEALGELSTFLGRQGIRVIPEAGIAPRLNLGPGVSLEALGTLIDLAVVVGGDGTLLSAARAMAASNIPLIGVNLGRLGFLVDISPGQIIEGMERVLSGACIEESRLMLSARLIRDQRVIFENYAVNDVVVHRSNAASMIELVSHVDGLFLNHMRSDGLIVSTPTGSTAYALSVGGPIVSPSLRALVLAPINPHALTIRPIVVDGDSIIGLRFRPGRPFGAQLICDNVVSPPLEVQDQIEIRRAAHGFRLLHPEGHNFFEILRAKLNWSSGHTGESC